MSTPAKKTAKAAPAVDAAVDLYAAVDAAAPAAANAEAPAPASVLMTRDGRSTLVRNNASVALMQALGWTLA